MHIAHRTAVRTSMHTCVRTASRLSHHNHTETENSAQEDSKKHESNQQERHDFDRIYVEDKDKTLEYLKRMHSVIDTVVQCVAIRWVNTAPEVSIELMDYTGAIKVTDRQLILKAIALGKLEVINAIVKNNRIVLVS